MFILCKTDLVVASSVEFRGHNRASPSFIRQRVGKDLQIVRLIVISQHKCSGLPSDPKQLFLPNPSLQRLDTGDITSSITSVH